MMIDRLQALVLTSICGFLLLPSFLFANGFDGPREVDSPVERLYVPHDYDANDNVEVVVFGFFPNSCYKTAHMTYHIDHGQRVIEVTPTSYAYPQGVGACATARIPFTQKAELGVLPVGDYKVRLTNGPELDDELRIREQRVSTPDDFLYAPVDSVRLVKGGDPERESESKASMILTGTYPRLFIGCMVMRDIKLTLEQKDILVVRPISEIVEGEACNSENKFQFSHEVPLPAGLSDKSLVLVRVTNGNTINQIYLD